MSLRRNRKNFPFTNSLPTQSQSDFFWRQEIERLYKFIEQELTDDFELLAGNVSSSSGGSVAWGDITDKPSTLAGFGITDAVSDAELTAFSDNLTTLYQPLNSKLSAISLLANAVGVLTNDGAGNFSYTASGGGGGGSFDIRDVWLLQ